MSFRHHPLKWIEQVEAFDVIVHLSAQRLDGAIAGDELGGPTTFEYENDKVVVGYKPHQLMRKLNEPIPTGSGPDQLRGDINPFCFDVDGQAPP